MHKPSLLKRRILTRSWLGGAMRNIEILGPALAPVRLGPGLTIHIDGNTLVSWPRSPRPHPHLPKNAPRAPFGRRLIWKIGSKRIAKNSNRRSVIVIFTTDAFFFGW